MKTPSLSRLSTGQKAFTLVEVLVSTVLIVAIMVLLLSTVDQTQRLWARARSKTTQFQSARAAFEEVSRRVAQSTLNTYWRAHDSSLGTAKKETSTFLFRRQAELQFISAPTKEIFTGNQPLTNLNGDASKASENYPGDAIFFAAPIGSTEYLDTSVTPPIRRFRALDSMLSGVGYFTEFGDDPSVPSFMRKLVPPFPERLRYRLMELTVPAEKFNIYSRPKDDKVLSDPRIFDEKNNYYHGLQAANRKQLVKGSFVRPLWMHEALSRVLASDTGSLYRFKYARVMAENVLGLIVLPKLAVKDRVDVGTTTSNPEVLELAPDYCYDSWRVLTGGDANDQFTGKAVDNRARDNLLPPIVQLTLVAIDEPSAQRINATYDTKPKWFNGLFVHANFESDVQKDLTTLETNIRDDPDYRGISYRIFTTDIIIRGSKWSRDPNSN